MEPKEAINLEESNAVADIDLEARDVYVEDVEVTGIMEDAGNVIEAAGDVTVDVGDMAANTVTTEIADNVTGITEIPCIMVSVGDVAAHNLTDNVAARFVCMTLQAFVAKVYFITAVQLIVTAAITITFRCFFPIKEFIDSSPASAYLYGFISILLFMAQIPLAYFITRRPHNMIFLGLYTLCMSLTVCLATETLKGMLLLGSAFGATIVLICLNVYTFWAAKKRLRLQIPCAILAGFGCVAFYFLLSDNREFLHIQGDWAVDLPLHCVNDVCDIHRI